MVIIAVQLRLCSDNSCGRVGNDRLSSVAMVMVRGSGWQWLRLCCVGGNAVFCGCGRRRGSGYACDGSDEVRISCS